MKIDATAYREVLVSAFDKHYAEGSDVWSRDPAMRCFPAIIQGRLKLPATAHALDIGCGAGKDAGYLAQLYASVVGLDIHAHHDWALLELEHPNLCFTAGSLTDFSSDIPFDLILDNGCFHHQHPEAYGAYLEQVVALLHPEGCYALSTFKNEGLDHFVDANGRLHRYFSDDALHAVLDGAGFTVFEEQDIYRIHKGDYYRLSLCRKER